jgi:signal transduction histidine kinase
MDNAFAYDAINRAHHKLQEAQTQLIQAEKMASLGQLTAGIAHEIKNPLNFVNNFSELSAELTNDLNEELDAQKDNIDEKSLSYIKELLADLGSNVKKINEHGKRADSIVKGMLLHSRGKSGELQPTDLNALLDEYIKLAYHGMRAQDTKFNVKIETDFDATLGSIAVVPQNISRVFLNIVNNACYSTNEKKKERGDKYNPILTVSTKKTDSKVEIRIRDNGKGIPQEIIDKVFNPFFTTKPTGKGTGLGLSLSYDIVVKEHQGDLKVNSEAGEFAEFIITIPTTLK